jgi:hypothetical protein
MSKQENEKQVRMTKWNKEYEGERRQTWEELKYVVIKTKKGSEWKVPKTKKREE